MSLMRCGVSTTVNVCVAGAELAFAFATFDEVLPVGAFPHAVSRIATKSNPNDLIKQPPKKQTQDSDGSQNRER
jgi:hypothetical protein